MVRFVYLFTPNSLRNVTTTTTQKKKKKENRRANFKKSTVWYDYNAKTDSLHDFSRHMYRYIV